MRHPLGRQRSFLIDDKVQNVTFESAKVLLKLVLKHMVMNAIEASASDEFVTLGAEFHGKEVEFWIHNPGAMSRDVQLQIFQRSFSTKGEGRGLGTYAMRLLSERYLKGHVSFTTSPLAGTKFHAIYPLSLEE
jgi:signal transduction histidine kinase